jgi:hypothetical protein
MSLGHGYGWAVAGLIGAVVHWCGCRAGLVNRSPRAGQDGPPAGPPRSSADSAFVATTGVGPLPRSGGHAALGSAVAEKTAPQQTHGLEVVELPQDRATAQKILRRFNRKGLKIESIESPRRHRDGSFSSRIYALTQPKLAADNTMKRRAVTVVFILDGNEITAHDFDGWVV